MSQNALGAIAVARELEVPFARIARRLRLFGRAPALRYSRAQRRMTVVDDYAHHPTAVRATIAAARQLSCGPVIVAFQPHRYSRTAYLARDFADALRGADLVFCPGVCGVGTAD